VPDWSISDDPAPVPVGDEVWVPDFQMVHRDSGRVIFVEVLGYWRKVDLDRHLAKLRKYLPGEFILAVGDSTRADEGGELESAPEVYRFKRTPSAAELTKYANSLTG
jgi:predicted nuclease of restriction endonuclease-like RecB superfamily